MAKKVKDCTKTRRIRYQEHGYLPNIPEEMGNDSYAEYTDKHAGEDIKGEMLAKVQAGIGTDSGEQEKQQLHKHAAYEPRWLILCERRWLLGGRGCLLMEQAVPEAIGGRGINDIQGI